MSDAPAAPATHTAPATPTAPALPDGWVAVVKRDCPTCVTVAPALVELAAEVPLTVLTQDDPSFPEGLPDGAGPVDDTTLHRSWLLDIETVPTLLHRSGGTEDVRLVGWDRAEWRAATGVAGLGGGLPEYRPGCGSLSVDPTRTDELKVRFEGGRLRSRRVAIAELEDEFEAGFDRGWTDGLPVVPPTEARVLRMLEGTTRDPDEVVAVVPPDLVECTVEKVAVNAVMAGCRPEYLPVVLAAVEAACTDEFNMHGLLATTWFSGPMVVVDGPIAGRIGMNWDMNAMGQGNRANATIGRALQLVVRNVGGGRPGGVDRSTLGNPGKYTFCFAERPRAELPGGPDWPAQATEMGIEPGTDTVTLFAAEGVRGFVDQLSREPESLARGLAAILRTVAHPKLALAFDAAVVLSPEHLRVFREGGWSKARLRERLAELTLLPPGATTRGGDGMAEGMPDGFDAVELPKFRDGGLLLFTAGGGAGLFSAVIGGWASGSMGSAPVTRRIGT
ncbi:MAG: thioredoxin [Microthrixaceae bacterium]